MIIGFDLESWKPSSQNPEFRLLQKVQQMKNSLSMDTQKSSAMMLSMESKNLRRSSWKRKTQRRNIRKTLTQTIHYNRLKRQPLTVINLQQKMLRQSESNRQRSLPKTALIKRSRPLPPTLSLRNRPKLQSHSWPTTTMGLHLPSNFLGHLLLLERREAKNPT